MHALLSQIEFAGSVRPGTYFIQGFDLMVVHQVNTNDFGDAIIRFAPVNACRGTKLSTLIVDPTHIMNTRIPI